MSDQKSGWEEHVLSELFDLLGGGTPKTSIAEYWDGGIPWLSVKDFNNDFRYVYSTEKTISKLGLEKSSTQLLHKDDIIISARGTIGELAMIPYPMSFNQSCYGIRARLTLTNPTFLYYLLKTCVEELKKNSHGSVFDTITRDTFDGITISLPPLETQKKIAAVLSSLDDKIEINARMNKVLEEIAQALFKRWFVDFEFPDGEGKPYKSAGGRMVESEMGMIPEGWEVKPVSSVLTINPKITLKKGTMAVYADMSALTTDSCSVSETSMKEYSGGSKFQNGDVLFARITPCLENGKTAIVDFLHGDEIGFGSTEFIILRGEGKITTPYVYCLARDDEFRRHCISSMVGSSGRQRVQNACFDDYLVAKAPSEIFIQFDGVCRKIFRLISAHGQNSRVLRETRDSLLPKLMSDNYNIYL